MTSYTQHSRPPQLPNFLREAGPAFGDCFLFFSFAYNCAAGWTGGAGISFTGCHIHTLQALLSAWGPIHRFRKKVGNPTSTSVTRPVLQYSFPGLCIGVLGACWFIKTAVFFHLAIVCICLPDGHNTMVHLTGIHSVPLHWTRVNFMWPKRVRGLVGDLNPWRKALYSIPPHQLGILSSSSEPTSTSIHCCLSSSSLFQDQ